MQLYQSLHMAILRVISNAECRSVYGDVVQDSHVCTSGTGRIGICRGDTGGPLVVSSTWRNILVSTINIFNFIFKALFTIERYSVPNRKLWYQISKSAIGDTYGETH